jgi:hypothetical protein
MPRVKSAVLLVFPLVLLAGCAALFDFNLYKDLGLDPVAAPRASDYAGAGGLDNLAADLGSPAIIDALSADDAAKADLVTFLDGIMNGDGTVDSPEEQQAAVLLADLELKTTGGEEFVNNIVTVLMSPYDPGVPIVDLLASIIPPEVANNPPAFTAMIEGLLAANDAYFALGQGIDSVNNTTLLPGADGLVDAGKSLPPYLNAGDIAQKAAIAFLANAIVGEVDGAAPGGIPEAIDEMFNLLYDQANLDPSVPPGMTMADPFGASTPELLAMEALYDAAGMTIPS